MTVRTNDGREQNRRTATAQSRVVDLSSVYKYKLPPIHPGDYTFHLTLLRAGLPNLSLDRMVTDFEWIDESSVLTGSVTAQRPDPADPSTLPVVRGQLMQCTVDWGSSTYRLWTMRVNAPQIQVDQGYVSIPLEDDMALLDETPQDWFFRKTKNRRFGYFCHEIAAEVCRRLGVKARTLAKGTTRMTLIKRNISGAAVIRAAYGKEQAASGRSFIMRFRDGELEIIPLQRNAQLYRFSRQIQTALITAKSGRKMFPTILTGTGHIGKGKHTKKIHFTASHPAAIKQYGRMHDNRNYGPVDSAQDLRNKVTRDLAKAMRIGDQITIEHQGIPFILRGDAAEIHLPAEGYTGERGLVFCTRGDHSVEAGIYTGTYDFGVTDPYLGALKAAQAAKAKRAKATERRERKKLKAAAGKAGS